MRKGKGEMTYKQLLDENNKQSLSVCKERGWVTLADKE